MFRALADMVFNRNSNEDGLRKIQEISEQSRRFEQSVIDAMQETFRDADSTQSSLDAE
jgi:hypothetical protein